jgi:hypothetical protein
MKVFDDPSFLNRSCAMAIKFPCKACGRGLRAGEEFTGKRAECPYCGCILEVPPGSDEVVDAELVPPPLGAATAIQQYFDPPDAAPQAPESGMDMSLRRMFEALLDPRSIQWMLTLGGGLCVLGLIVWLTSLGVFENKLVLAAVLGLGSLAVLGAGWWVSLKTRFRIAGQALTFLGCVVAPLNLWFYAHFDLVSVEDHLWIGGVVCCLLYIATVYVLRDPLFVYAVEAGATLTLALLLAEFGKAGDTSFLALTLMALGLASIHVERAFAPDGEPFTRQRFGLPFFWSGHAQIGVALLILLGTQVLGWLAGPEGSLRFGWIVWQGNWLTEYYLLASGLWLAGVYAYLYSDLVVRRVGVYTCLAAFSLVMAEATIAGRWLHEEGWIAVLAVTALGVNLLHLLGGKTDERIQRVLPPLAMVLGSLPILIGLLLHIRATSAYAAEIEWQRETGAAFVVVMLLVAVCNRMSAWLFEDSSPRWSAVNLFGSAAALLLAAAGLLRLLDLRLWTQQAPWLMLFPIAYLIAARLWRGHFSERPLGWVAHTAAAVILFHVLVACLQMVEQVVQPLQESPDNLILGLVFAEAAVFYALAAVFRRRSANIYFAALALCGALWQFVGYFGVPVPYYTMLYAVLGIACLALARVLGIQRVPVYQALSGEKALATRGHGLAPFQMGNAILLIASLAAVMQGLNRIAAGSHQWRDLGALAVTTLAALAAVCLSPGGFWRRLYVTNTVALAAVSFLTLNVLINLNAWQKLEIFCVAVGMLLILASYVGRFRESDSAASELISVGLWLGSLLATVPLVTAVIYYRFAGPETAHFSAVDELALLAVTLVMLVTGYSWQIKATTFFGGVSLVLYLMIVVVSLGWQQQLAAGVYLAVGGAVLFGLGIALSIYREQLLQLPERIAKREGFFRVLNWR